MDFLKVLYALILALPEILRIIRASQEQKKEEAIEAKKAEDDAKISKAMKEQDAKALNDLFNSK